MLPQDLLIPFVLTLPAYVANPTAVFWGGGAPMDFGRTWRGRRVLGDGKTWAGFLGGALTGAALGALLTPGILLLAAAIPVAGPWYAPMDWGFARVLLAFAVMSFGALLGDVFGAFVKRRVGLERGARAPGLDQYDFLLGALLLLALHDPAFLIGGYLSGDRAYGLLLVIVITPALHRAVNIVGFRMGKKKEPW